MNKDQKKPPVRFGPDLESELRMYDDNNYQEKLSGFSALWDKYRSNPKASSGKGLFSLISKYPVFTYALSAAALIFIVFFISLQFSANIPLQNFQDGKALLLTRMSGEILFGENNGEKSHNDGKAAVLNDGGRLRTGINSYCELQLYNRIILKVEGSSDMRLTHLDNRQDRMHVSIFLASGSIFLKPEKLKSGESLRVETSSVLLSVTGTKFKVETLAGGDTKVFVSEGTVLLMPKIPGKTADSAQLKVQAGEMAAVKPGDFGNSLKNNGILKQAIPEDEKKSLDGFNPDLFRKTAQVRVFVTAEPDRSKVFINGNFQGLTPYLGYYKTNEKFGMIIRNDGFEDYSVDETTLVKPVKLNIKLQKNRPVELIQTKPYISREAVLYAEQYQNRLVFSIGPELRIYSDNGNLIKSIQISENAYSLTKPVIHKNRIYIGSESGGIYCYDMSGSLLWSDTASGKEYFNTSPAVGSDYVAVPSIDKGIRIYDTTGKLIREIDLKQGDSIYSTPILLKNGMMIYGTLNGDITAYDIPGKKGLWLTNIGSGEIVYPLFGDDQSVFVLTRGKGSIISIRPENGAVNWVKTIPEIRKTAFKPIYTGNYLILSGNLNKKGNVTIIKTVDGAIYKNLAFEENISAISAGGGFLLIGLKTGAIKCYDLSGGIYKWSAQAGSEPVSLIAGNETVFIIGRDRISRVQK